jgi:hypothetical protein
MSGSSIIDNSATGDRSLVFCEKSRVLSFSVFVLAPPVLVRPDRGVFMSYIETRSR